MTKILFWNKCKAWGWCKAGVIANCCNHTLLKMWLYSEIRKE